MAYQKRVPKANAAFQKLKSDLAAGTAATAYLFYGEESYLREYYLRVLEKTLIAPDFADFNCRRMEGKDLDILDLAEMMETVPMLSERTLTVVTDLDLSRLDEERRGQLIALLEDLPPYGCLVFAYDTVDYKPGKIDKKLSQALAGRVEAVEFRAAESGDLLDWIARRFRAMGKEIDRQTAEHLAFTCGGLMMGLVPEIAKIGDYAKGRTITVRDIDAVADPVLSAEAFRLSDAVMKGENDRAAQILGDLLKMQTEPIAILAVLGSQLRRIYTARLALDSGRDKFWLMDLWGYSSDYPVKLLLSAAKRTTAPRCAQAVKLCHELDKRMKSQRGADPQEELKLLLARLQVGQ